jgi:RNA polymerase sigma-70 factor (ECF subfamily)
MAIDGFALDALTDPDGDSQSDSSLMGRLVEGSQDALASLYDRHAQAVFATALRVSRDRAIAEEVVQETFLALWNRAERYDASRGALIAWLLTIARNRAIDRLRSAGRHERATTFSSFDRDGWDDQATVEWLTSTGELIGAAGTEPGPEMALADKETREVIQDALASLAPLERRVIELAYGEGMSQSEIAAHLGVEVPLSRVQIEADGQSIVVSDGHQRWEPTSGQVTVLGAMMPRQRHLALHRMNFGKAHCYQKLRGQDEPQRWRRGVCVIGRGNQGKAEAQ